MSDSTIYTIGTALNRAKASDTPVQVLVDGHWLSGRVVAVDGHGLVLESDEMDHAVVRIERVTAVRIFSPVPDRTPITAGAHAMPAGPRTPYE